MEELNASASKERSMTPKNYMIRLNCPDRKVVCLHIVVYVQQNIACRRKKRLLLANHHAFDIVGRIVCSVTCWRIWWSSGSCEDGRLIPFASRMNQVSVVSDEKMRTMLCVYIKISTTGTCLSPLTTAIVPQMRNSARLPADIFEDLVREWMM
jgi:hypothetical protein